MKHTLAIILAAVVGVCLGAFVTSWGSTASHTDVQVPVHPVRWEFGEYRYTGTGFSLKLPNMYIYKKDAYGRTVVYDNNGNKIGTYKTDAYNNVVFVRE